MKKIICLLLVVVCVTLSAVAESYTVKKDGKNVGTVTCEVIDYKYINRAGWGHSYTLKVTNNTSYSVYVSVRPKGVSSDNAYSKNADISANSYNKDSFAFSTGEDEPTGWEITAWVN